MNEIGIYNNMTIDSREVAEWVEKRHDHLCRDIAGYIAALTNTPQDWEEWHCPQSWGE